jgi:protein involved in polysaccharide export with SLBB domain
MSRSSKVLIAFLVLASVGCSSGVPKPEPYLEPTAQKSRVNDKASPSEGQLVAGNEVSIKSTVDSRINVSTIIPWDGMVLLSDGAQAKISGLSVVDAQRAVEKALASTIKVSSHIKIKVISTKVMVKARGLVAKPGEYVVAKGGSIDELVALAGGLVRPADGLALPSVATVTTAAGARFSARMDDYYSGQSEEVPVLQGGETVLFHDGVTAQSNSIGVSPGRVRFIGQVKRPGEFPVRDGANVMLYLVQAGGPTDRADMRGSRVWRLSEGKVREFPLGGNESDEKFQLVAGDLVYVPADVRTPIERATGIASGFGSVIGGLAATVLAVKD